MTNENTVTIPTTVATVPKEKFKKDLIQTAMRAFSAPEMEYKELHSILMKNLRIVQAQDTHMRNNANGGFAYTQSLVFTAIELSVFEACAVHGLLAYKSTHAVLLDLSERYKEELTSHPVMAPMYAVMKRDIVRSDVDVVINVEILDTLYVAYYEATAKARELTAEQPASNFKAFKFDYPQEEN